MKYLFLGMFLCISTSVFSQDLDCQKFKNGKFSLTDEHSGTSIIERKGSRQTEYGENSGLKLKFKVNWIDECTYTLELKKVIANPNNLPIIDDMILKVNIIEVKEGSYIQQTTSTLFEMVLEGEMIQID